MSVLLEARGLWLPRGRHWTLDVPHLQVQEGEILTLLGPNGAGKSTLVAVLAGLLPPRRGELRFRGHVVDFRRNLDYRRRIAVVLQRPVLFRGTVWANVEMGLRFRGVPPAVRREKVQRWLQRLGLGELAQRPARRLSGGQAQRVALARALVLDPELLFLDEPFQALDAPTRRDLLLELRDLLQAEGRTAVYVTHDLTEGLALAHRVAVMVEGRIRQIGPPEAILYRPVDLQVARLVGMENVLPCRVQAKERQLAFVEACGCRCTALAAEDVTPGAPAYLGLRPEALMLTLEEPQAGTSARNRFPARVRRIWPQGALMRVQVQTESGCTLWASVTYLAAQELGLDEGQRVWVVFKASAAWVFREGEGSRLSAVGSQQ